MSKKNNYNFPAEEIRQELKRKKGIVNIVVPESAEPLEKTKYSLSQSILTYHLETKKSLAAMVKEIEITTLTEKRLLDICRGQISDFSLGELIIYANNLRINFIPCYHCGFNLFPSLLESLILQVQKTPLWKMFTKLTLTITILIMVNWIQKTLLFLSISSCIILLTQNELVKDIK